MAIVRTDDKHYKAIADTLRSVSGDSDLYTPEQLPSVIRKDINAAHGAGINVGYTSGYSAGYEVGEEQGYNIGFTDGYDEGETNGKDLGNQEAYDTFWDIFQQKGSRVAYSFAFYFWNDKIFKPKYPIIPTGNADSIFRSISGIEDLAEYFETNNITVDLSSVTSCNDGFGAFSGKRIGELNLSNCGTYNYLFTSCKNLETIDKLILRDSGTPTYNGAFIGCTNLKNIVIGGSIRNNIDFKSCTLLTHESLMSIINALMTNTSGTKTLTLGTDNLDKLSDAEKAIATERGWTLA